MYYFSCVFSLFLLGRNKRKGKGYAGKLRKKEEGGRKMERRENTVEGIVMSCEEDTVKMINYR